MSCPSCAHKNPAGSVFCQNCGFRLPAEPAPVAAPATIACNRCGAQQSAHMRFCTECGNSLPGLPAAPQPVVQQPAPMPQPARPAPTGVAQPPASIGQAVAEQISGAIGGPLCWRCRGVGDNGSEFCKFCGARYSDAPNHAPAAQPAPYVAPQPAAQPAPYVAPQAAPVQAYAQPAPVMPAPQPAAFAVAATVGPVPGPATTVARLVSILKDGSDGQAFSLKEGNTDIGRSEGDIVLADDPYLSPRHARVRSGAGRFYVRDLDSANGVYIRLTAPVELTSGDFILIGQQVLRFEVLQDGELPLGPASISGVLAFGTPEVPRFARLVQYTTEGVGRDLHYLYRDETVLGRENGDIVFTDDPFLSRRHASIDIERTTKRCRLKDVGSSNGTSLRVRGERELAHGDHFRVGRHLFRFDANGGTGR